MSQPVVDGGASVSFRNKAGSWVCVAGLHCPLNAVTGSWVCAAGLHCPLNAVTGSWVCAEVFTGCKCSL